MTRSPQRNRILLPALALGLFAAGAAAAAPAKPAKKATPKASAKARDIARTLALVHTSQGDFTIRFFADRAPNHVKNFIDLAAQGFTTARFSTASSATSSSRAAIRSRRTRKRVHLGNAGRTDAKGNP